MIILKTAQEQLLSTLQSVAGIVERRHTMPVLANVLLKKEGDTVQLTTNDLEIQIRTHADRAKEARRMDVFIHYGIAAALQAIDDAGLDALESLDKDRVGTNKGITP